MQTYGTCANHEQVLCGNWHFIFLNKSCPYLEYETSNIRCHIEEENFWNGRPFKKVVAQQEEDMASWWTLLYITYLIWKENQESDNYIKDKGVSRSSPVEAFVFQLWLWMWFDCFFFNFFISFFLSFLNGEWSFDCWVSFDP